MEKVKKILLDLQSSVKCYLGQNSGEDCAFSIHGKFDTTCEPAVSIDFNDILGKRKIKIEFDTEHFLSFVKDLNEFSELIKELGE